MFTSDGGLTGPWLADHPVHTALGFIPLPVARLLALLPHRPTPSANLGIERALCLSSFGSAIHELVLFMGLFVTYKSQCGFSLQPQNLNF
jgi:hypothetical protein